MRLLKDLQSYGNPAFKNAIDALRAKLEHKQGEPVTREELVIESAALITVALLQLQQVDYTDCEIGILCLQIIDEGSKIQAEQMLAMALQPQNKAVN
jgi:hypothetical protein